MLFNTGNVLSSVVYWDNIIKEIKNGVTLFSSLLG